MDILEGTLHSARADGSSRTSRVFPHTVSAVVPRAGGGLALAGDAGVLLLDVDGRVESVHHVEADVPSNRLGDVGVDPAGRLYWLGTLDREMLLGRGSLYRLDPDGTLTRVLSETGVANGLGWSPDGTRMYFIDSATFRVDVFDYDASDGSATDRRPWVTVDHADGSPDGLAVDEGGVWVALFGGGHVRRYAPDGTLDVVLSVPARQVTSCCFGGEDLGRLFVTSARVELDERDLLLEPLAGSVFADPGFRGLAQTAYAG